MTSELNRVEPLPKRTRGAATGEPLGPSAPVVPLTCPSCSAELTSMVDDAIAPAEDDKVPPVKWTTEAKVLAATLQALRAPVAVTPVVEAPRPVEDTSSTPQTPHLRLVLPPPPAVSIVDTSATTVDSPRAGRPRPNEQPTPRTVIAAHGDSNASTTDDAGAVNRARAFPARRRRQGLFSRVLTSWAAAEGM
jgi:hypothetical protein